MKIEMNRVLPNKNCNTCKHFIIADDPAFYIDSFHFFCSKETFVNEYGDREPACIDGYYYTDYVCPLFEKSYN